MRIDINSLIRFCKYSIVGLGTFLFDITLLLFLVYVLSINYIVATPVAFLVAVTINYFISRSFVFKGTKRELLTGLLFFILLAGSGAMITVALVYSMVEYLALALPISRVLASLVVGVWTYLSNLFFNFKVAGKHYD